MTPLRVTILDRYLMRELGGPFAFALSAFTLIFVATQILTIGRLVSEEHAPLIAAIEYFLWQMPYYLVLVIPMAVLLGTLLAMQRLSSESEITAMKAGGVSLLRIVAPLAAVGIALSLVALLLQEVFVPLANERADYIKEAVIEHVNPAAANLDVVTPLPNGGKQRTIAGAFDVSTQSLLNVNVLQSDREGHLGALIVSARARYSAPTWIFDDATTYRFDGTDVTTSVSPTLSVDIGQAPDQVAKRSLSINNPEELSRAEIKSALNSGQLNPAQTRSFTATYAAKLARPFSSLVFVLIAVPLALRPVRGGGAGLGFGLSIAIIFVYYVVSSVLLSIGELSPWLAGIAAWTPNATFSLIGLLLLRRASAI